MPKIVRNIENLTKVLYLLKSEACEFSMYSASVKPACNSAGCIAGHAAMVFKEVRAPHWSASQDDFTWDKKKLKTKLGLKEREYVKLFYQAPTRNGETQPLELITRTQAVQALQRFIKTGEIWFSKVRYPAYRP